jgi:hypothetical protein
MQLSENDKDLYLAKKENIRKVSSEIINLLNDSPKNELKIKEKRTEILDRMTIILGYLSDLSIITNSENSKPYLLSFRNDFWAIQVDFEREGRDAILRNEIERFCSRATSIEFFDEKKGWFSEFEIRIKDWISLLIKR